MNEGNINQNGLDFEKMNATLANPEFANWYYNQMLNSEKTTMTMQDFVQIVNEFDENNLH